MASKRRRLIEIAILFAFATLLFRTVGVETNIVTTASMAPTLLGHHRCGTCPRCGCQVQVGYVPEEPLDGAYYRHAFCPNCGCDTLGLEDAPICRGDSVLVNRSLFDWSGPRRWELAVFRCPAHPRLAYVKRVVGLPGESVLVRDGDLYVDGELARKTLEETKAMRILVHDFDCRPPEGWGCRWKRLPVEAASFVEEHRLLFDAENRSCFQWLRYHNWDLDERKDSPILDEYGYNGVNGHGRAPVHDFMVECDVQCLAGNGDLSVGITDGDEEFVAVVPAGHAGDVRLENSAHLDNSDDGGSDLRRAAGKGLAVGAPHRLEFAFVDRRLTLAIDGTLPFPPIDLPSPGNRDGVSSPVRLGARGVRLEVTNLRIFRDVHYTNHGKHGVAAGVSSMEHSRDSADAVHLGAGEYFVLGDNSPNSEDSRVWDESGRAIPVRENSLLGKPFLLHLPGRVVTREWLGRTGQFQTVDWQRVRWLR
jgi:signal peptidase I